MRSIWLGCFFGLWITTAACGQADEPMTLDTAPAASQPVPQPEIPDIQVEPLQLEPTAPAAATAAAPESAPASAPATQPAPLRIAGLPAGQWLGTPAPLQGHNFEGRLWILAVLEPWSDRSRQTAADLAALARANSLRGVDIILVTTAPADEVRRYPALESLSLPIGAVSPLPLLLPLEPLPRVYLVGPDFAIVWTGSAKDLAGVLPGYYEQLTPDGLAKTRENQLTNRLNRAKAAASPAQSADTDAASRYFTAVGLASIVADATPVAHPLHRQAAELLADLDKRGDQLLADAQRLQAEGKSADACQALQRVAEGFYSRPAGILALHLLQDMGNNPRQQAAIQTAREEASARDALRMAREALADHRYADAQRLCQMIGQVYPRTQVAGQARQTLATLRKDKAAATQLAEQKAQPDAPVLLSLASRYAQMGRTDQARRYLQHVLQIAPGTTYARQAQEDLALLPAASQPAKPTPKNQ